MTTHAAPERAWQPARTEEPPTRAASSRTDDATMPEVLDRLAYLVERGGEPLSVAIARDTVTVHLTEDQVEPWAQLTKAPRPEHVHDQLLRITLLRGTVQLAPGWTLTLIHTVNHGASPA